MKPEVFLENVDLVSGASKGIESLRAYIFQLAAQGNLNTQDSKDEPANLLLQCIGKDKGEVLKESTGPFVLPKGWLWALISDISNNVQYGYTDSASAAGNARLLRITDIQNDRVNWNTVPYCDVKKSDLEKYRLNQNDLLIARTGGTIGKSFLANECPENAIFASYLIRIVPSRRLHEKYLKVFADSPLYWKQLREKSMGTGQPNVNGTSLSGLLFPLPPYEEQKRIVEKVDQLMALCDELEAKQEKQTHTRRQLNDAALNALLSAASPEEFEKHWQRIVDNFDLLYEDLDNLQSLRQAILQLAVNGKLISFDPNEKNINKPLEKVCRFIDYRGKTPKKTKSGLRLITAKNIRMGFIKNNPEEFISPNDYDGWMTRGFPKNGDVLITTEAPLGNVAIFNFDEKIALAQRVINLQPIFKINSKYLLYALMSPKLQSALVENSTGMTAKGIKSSRLKKVLVPFPDLDIQEKVVEKVDQLMALCDELEKKLTAKSSHLEKIAESLLRV